MNIHQRMVLTFHKKFNCHIGTTVDVPDDDELVELRIRLMYEELEELRNALRSGDIVETADGIADLLYVVYGTAISCGLDIEPIFAEVHAANMRKSVEGKRIDGKVQKPAGWQGPRVAELVALQQKGD